MTTLEEFNKVYNTIIKINNYQVELGRLENVLNKSNTSGASFKLTLDETFIELTINNSNELDVVQALYNFYYIKLNKLLEKLEIKLL